MRLDKKHNNNSKKLQTKYKQSLCNCFNIEF